MDQDEEDDDEHFRFIEPEALTEPATEREPQDRKPTPPPKPSKKGKGKAHTDMAMGTSKAQRRVISTHKCAMMVLCT